MWHVAHSRIDDDYDRFFVIIIVLFILLMFIIRKLLATNFLYCFLLPIRIQISEAEVSVWIDLLFKSGGKKRILCYLCTLICLGKFTVRVLLIEKML